MRMRDLGRSLCVAAFVGAMLTGLVLCRPRAQPAQQTAFLPPVESTHVLVLGRHEGPASALIRDRGTDPQAAIMLARLADFGPSEPGRAPESLVVFFRNERAWRLEYRARYDRTWLVLLDSNSTRIASAYHWVRTVPTVIGSAIQSSLWSSMISVGLKPDMIMRFADLFSWDIDFFTETQPGDSFKLLVEQLYVDDRPIGPARLQVGEYKGKIGDYYGFFYQDPTGHKDYYTRTGESVRKGFLRSPLQYSRISSHFSSGRYHPILRYVRPHHGLDYAARTGTPVSAIGDGVVVQRGWCGGYGNLVTINHGNGYQSRYGHLSRFGKIRTGGRVSQGQVVGYVGATGMATGPHLHFEVRLNGVPRNPLKIIPPRAAPVAPGYLAAFKARADSLTQLLNSAAPDREDFALP